MKSIGLHIVMLFTNPLFLNIPLSTVIKKITSASIAAAICKASFFPNPISISSFALLTIFKVFLIITEENFLQQNISCLTISSGFALFSKSRIKDHTRERLSNLTIS